jgi:hypothetical protein
MALAAPAPAAEQGDISPGMWVRLTIGTRVASEGFEANGRSPSVAKPGTTLQGAVRSLDEKTLILERPGESPVLVPRDAISRLDVRRRQSKKALGLGIGLLAGGAIGYAIGAATSGPGCQGGETGFEHLCALDDLGKPVGAIVGVVAGAVLGLVVAPGAKWEKNVAFDRVRVGIGPRPHRGIGLSLSVTF